MVSKLFVPLVCNLLPAFSALTDFYYYLMKGEKNLKNNNEFQQIYGSFS